MELSEEATKRLFGAMRAVEEGCPLKDFMGADEIWEVLEYAKMKLQEERLSGV